jgi:CheY-like chemotaxis protein
MTNSGFASLRVLVADDNPNMRTILVQMLKSLGILSVVEARDGQHAFETLGRWEADLAIVDFQMQPVDGVQFTRMMRTGPGTPNPYLPIIMLTGHSEEHRVGAARDAGVTEFLVKPVNAKDLLDRFHSVVYRQRPFIKTATYFGPDRRRKVDPRHKGPWRREADRERAAGG